MDSKKKIPTFFAGPNWDMILARSPVREENDGSDGATGFPGPNDVHIRHAPERSADPRNECIEFLGRSTRAEQGV